MLDFRGDKIADGFARAVKNKSITNYSNSANENETGTAEVFSLWGRKHIKLREQPIQGQASHYSTGMSWDVPDDTSGERGSLNDYIFCKQVFQSENAGQYGYIKITVSDSNGQFLYGVETIKRSNGQGCEFNVLRPDSNSKYDFLKCFTFTGTADKRLNPFSSERGQFELRRNNDRVQVYYNGSYHTFIIPEIKDRKSAKIHATIGAFHNKPIVSHMYLDELMYRKDFVPAIGDVPNRYPIGSNVILNSENDTVTVDGVERAVDVVQGSKFLSIPPGRSQLEVYCSSWIKTKPTVTVEFKERYL